MVFEEFGSYIKRICARSSLVRRGLLIYTVIVNPMAGGFTIPSRWTVHQSRLLEAAEKAEQVNPKRDSIFSATALEKGGDYSKLGLVLTEKPGDAAEFAESVLNEANIVPENLKSVKQRHPFYLIISAGGDGTHREVQTFLARVPEKYMTNVALLRLPMGTGNDGADGGGDLRSALDLLINRVEITQQRAVELTTAGGKDSFLAFNILSVGLDAFVTHMTNKMKTKLPGDSYKLWVDIAALFYDIIYRVGYMDVRALDADGKEIQAFREKLLLLAVGASGHRTYGSGNRILPDDRNVCAVKQMPLSGKIAFKKLVAEGTHADKSGAILLSAKRVEFSAKHPILAQMDGETVRLEKGDFPAVMELTEPFIPVLKKAGSAR